jgi:hypothetical protein
VKAPRIEIAAVGLILCLAGILARPAVAVPFSLLADSEQLTAVSSKQFNGYVRTKLADGSFQAETFAFGEGGLIPEPSIPSLDIMDPTIDGLNFPAIAKMLSGPLASQEYVAARDPNKTKLLIMVYWGKTIGGVNFKGFVGSGQAQDVMNFVNAKLLGFGTEADFLGQVSGATIMGEMQRNAHPDVMSTVQVNRYYVILRAFDFQSVWKQKKFRQLWETRFSLSNRLHKFDRDLPAMAQSASVYFGQDSYGMVKAPLMREGHVEIGEANVVEDQPEVVDLDSLEAGSRIAGDWLENRAGVTVLVVHIDSAGRSTFENPSLHTTIPAHVSLRGGSVTIAVPGWDVLFRGTLNEGKITGTLVEYGKSAPVTLTKIPGDPDK